ncbi:MAG TPA: TonB-dependent receptor [Candidatus Kryptonia bacterium]|nr:TonB-dependent receptor [Candidatus Kryptonia bacterium]
MRLSRGIACGVLSSLWLICVNVPANAQQNAPTNATEGTIAGRVLDKSSGDPIIEAGVEVTQTGKRARTDLDGKFTIKVPAGTYELRIFAPLYTGTRLTNVVVNVGGVANADANLAPEGQAGIEVVEVVAQADKAAESTQLLQRKKSAVVSDNIAAETIAKSPDKNAAEVVKRVPAVTVQNDKFVFVRGLGERYSSALLNGSRLPSTDPSKRVVPLDLFPAEFVESISILKTYTPDLPGDFSGGLVDIRLKEFPERLRYALNFSTGFNTNATFQHFDTYHADGRGLDYLGFGESSRALPSFIPDQNIATPPAAQQRAYASAFENSWDVNSMTAPPNFTVNGSFGNTFGPLGASLGVLYATEYKRHPDEFAQNFTNGGMQGGHVTITPFGDLSFDRSIFQSRLGAVLSSGYKLDPDNKVTVRALIDRNSTDEVVDGTGHDRNNLEQPITQSRLQYTEEQLGYGQVAGAHHWPAVDLDWRTAISQTTQSQPDTRFVAYNLPTATNDLMGLSRQYITAGEGPESGLRTFADLDEYLSDSAIDLTIPFKTGLPGTDFWSGLPAKFKFGPAYAYRRRTFDFRRFLYNRVDTANLDQSLSVEELLIPEHIPANYSFREGTQAQDSFTASQEIAAIYGMVDLPLIRDQLRVVAGVRVEYSYIATDSSDMQGNSVHPTVNDLSPLPGVNLIYSPRDDMNVRYGYSRSVSRPEFRELTPTEFPVPNGERPLIGNPFLVSADIESHDLRWEWFLSPSEVVSVGAFYKSLDKPIEQVVIGQSAGEADSFRNAKDATLKGFEFEARKNLGFLSSRLTNLNFLTNVAYIDSTVNVPQVPGEVQTSSKRALQGQAPFVVNAALEYDHPTWGSARLLYNTIDSRIVAAGANGLPDIFDNRRDKLDLVLLSKINPFGTPLTVKLAAENLLDQPFEETQGGFTAQRFTAGVKVTLGLTYEY